MKILNKCRCCLTEMCFKDMSNEYYHNGFKEVYSDILYDTFNIKIPYKEDLRNLICEDCILQLRSCAAFRRQVLHAANVMLSKQSSTVSGVLSPKSEFDDFFDHMVGEFDDDDADEDIVTKWQNNDAGKEQHFIIKMEPKLEDKVSKGYIESSELLDVSDLLPFEDSGDVSDYFEVESVKDRRKRKTQKEKLIKDPKKLKDTIPQSQKDMKENSLKLIKNSNLCLFDSLKTKFRCFYCKEAFLQMSELRQHSQTHVQDKYLAMCIKRLRGMSYKCVDISSLKCSICHSELDDLNCLRDHLSEHDINFPTSEHLLIPYRLQEGFKCVICGEDFNTFYRLSIHMNSHYTNNVCEMCGMSYINRLSLRSHVHSMHREKKCSKCPATFLNNYSRVKHMRKAHNSRSSVRYCLLCDKTFPYTYMLVEHKIQEHGVKRTVNQCQDCGKTFLTPQNLKIHVRSVHIRERNHACSLCGMGFFTKCDQRRHEKTHQDVRSFGCSYCEGRFKSKDSLRRHMKRQHGHLFVSLPHSES